MEEFHTKLVIHDQSLLVLSNDIMRIGYSSLFNKIVARVTFSYNVIEHIALPSLGSKSFLIRIFNVVSKTDSCVSSDVNKGIAFFLYLYAINFPVLVAKPANRIELSISITWPQISSIERSGTESSCQIVLLTCYYYYFSIAMCALEVGYKFVRRMKNCPSLDDPKDGFF